MPKTASGKVCDIVAVKGIKADHGRECENEKLVNFCNSRGICHEFSTLKTPQQNGVS